MEEELLEYLIALLLYHLDVLKDVKNTPEKQFAYGEKTAYVECLEVLSEWDKAKKYGLDFEVEERYPL